ncbi:MAG: TRL domain-containing protein [Candidatus Electryonea clarkiae]|nr:TRL domain-containing protein [Candidatus Stygibacter australis]MDP8285411.1 TRL domain-containing protein [Candidatus Electryonea clarkiae]
MSKRLIIVVLLVVILLISACSMNLPLAATSNPVGTKIGTSTAKVYFGIFMEGDASIKTAAQNGGITKISTVDYKITNEFLWYIVSMETIVTGE